MSAFLLIKWNLKGYSLVWFVAQLWFEYSHRIDIHICIIYTEAVDDSDTRSNRLQPVDFSL